MAAVAPKTEPDTQVDTKPEVQADPGLNEIYDKKDRAQETVSNLLTEITDYIEEHELSREVVRKTLEERGLQPHSINVELSRVFALLKPKNASVRERLRAGEITVRVARQEVVRSPHEFDIADYLEKVAKSIANQIQVAAKKALLKGYSKADFSSALTSGGVVIATQWNAAIKAHNEAKTRKAKESRDNGDETNE